MAKLHANLKGIIALLGDRMYSGSPIETAVKELLQNSFDAIKAELKNGLAQGLIDIEYDHAARTICITDNGCGMTSEVVTKAFFGIAETYKEGLSTEERSGGFGAAKVQFLLFPDWIELQTTKNGIETSCWVSREELIEGVEFSLKQEPTSKANGTSVTICIPKMNNKGEQLGFEVPTGSSIKKYLPMGNVKVHVHGTYSNWGWYVNDSFDCNKLFEFPFLGTAETVFGLIDIYMGAVSSYKSTGEVVVYSAGIRQFKDRYGDWQHKHAPVIINIKPSVDAHHELYPINNQRQGWSSKVKPEIDDLYAFLAKICCSLEGRKIKKMFSKATNINDTVTAAEIYNEVDELNCIAKEAWNNFATEESVTKVSQNSSNRPILSVKKVHEARQEQNRNSSFKGFDVAFEELAIDTSDMDIKKAVIYNNTSLTLYKYQEFLNLFGACLIQFRDKVSETYPNASRLDQFWGVALDKSFLGVCVSPKIFNFIGINPFSFEFGCAEEVNYTTAITEHILHIILHELTHNKVNGHNAKFCAALGYNYGIICGLPWFNSWKHNLYELVAENIVLITEATKAYKSASNVGDTILEEAD